MSKSEISENKVLITIAIIAVVNALGYGIIIPILYPYSVKFGLNDFQNGLLFALFSICQFISTPILGRLSDKYGRKPMLLVSLGGTAVSFLLAAFAQNAVWLFLSRALDGITAGNIPVAQAVISDTTDAKNRSKGFGIIGASFGFGFVFGPAISALTVHLGNGVPFLIAACVTVVAVVLTALLLPETNKHMGEVKHAGFFNLKAFVGAFTDVQTRNAFWVILLYSMAFSLFIYAFQPLANRELRLSTQQVAMIFTAIGVMGVVVQVGLLPRIVKKFGDKRGLLISLGASICSFSLFTLVPSFDLIIVASLLNSLVSGPIQPLSQAVLSKNVDAKSQGTILGLSASALAVGQIIGPILGGAVALESTRLPFVVTAVCIAVAYLFARGIPSHPARKESTF